MKRSTSRPLLIFRSLAIWSSISVLVIWRLMLLGNWYIRMLRYSQTFFKRISHLIQFLQFLSSQFRNESSRWANILSERQQAPPRWKQCVSSTQRYLGFLIGHYFVQSQFPNGTLAWQVLPISHAFTKGSKEVALDLVQNLQTTFATSINKLEWMDKQTKDNALKKLSKITNKIGKCSLLSNKREKCILVLNW